LQVCLEYEDKLTRMSLSSEDSVKQNDMSAILQPVHDMSVGILVVFIDFNPSYGFWTARLMKVFGHEGQCTCI
jgi:hypothetical protein